MKTSGESTSVKQFLRRHSTTRSAVAGPRALHRAWLNWRGHAGEVILERISEIVKGDVVFEAREFGGVFSIDPRSHLLHRFLRYGYYEPQVTRLFLAHIQPNLDVLDVGANVGFFTVAGAKKLSTGRVLAAEPTRTTFKRLSENVKRNNVADRVILFNGMIGADKGQGQIHFVPGMEEYSSMNIPEHAAVKNKELHTDTVPIERIDDLVDEYNLHPALLKVDVEGAEFSVFKGALSTVSKYRPVVISEIWKDPTNADGHSGAELVQMFKNLDYAVLDPHGPLIRPGLELVGEIICIPKEKFDTSLFGADSVPSYDR